MKIIIFVLGFAFATIVSAPLISFIYNEYRLSEFTKQIVNFSEANSDGNYSVTSNVFADVGSGAYCTFVVVARFKNVSNKQALVERFQQFDFTPAVDGGRPKVDKDVLDDSEQIELSVSQGGVSGFFDFRCL